MKYHNYAFAKGFLGLIIIGFLIFLQSCKNEALKEQVVTVNQSVSIDDIANLINDEKYQLIDLRTHDEVKENGTIPFSKIVDFSSNDFEHVIDAMDKNGKYILYCKSGGRSGKALKVLNEKGFKNVKEMNAGYDAWSAKFK